MDAEAFMGDQALEYTTGSFHIPPLYCTLLYLQQDGFLSTLAAVAAVHSSILLAAVREGPDLSSDPFLFCWKISPSLCCAALPYPSAA